MTCKICRSLSRIKDDPYFITELETGYVILGWYQKFEVRGNSEEGRSVVAFRCGEKLFYYNGGRPISMDFYFFPLPSSL